MKTWIVRFASLYVFNLVVLIAIGLFTPAHVGWAVIWASVILTLAVLFVKPAVHKLFTGAAAKSAGERTKVGEALVQVGIVLLVATIVWIITLLLTGVNAKGSWFWAYVLPPIIIAIGWYVYSKIDDRVEAKAGTYYDSAEAKLRGGSAPAAAAPAPATEELRDGLTPEQRKMLDDIGS